jgi:hypothetical protein
MNTSIAAEATISTQAIADMPRKRPDRSAESRGELALTTVFCVKVNSAPATMFMTANVPRSGRIPKTTTAVALSTPTTSPVAIDAPIASASGYPA